MKTTLTAVTLALLSVGPLAAQSSVWKITKDGNTLYLGGTCHVLRPTDMPLPAEFDAAFNDADVVCFETDIARMQSPEAQQMLMSKAVFTDGTTLATVLSPEAWQALQDYCAKAGIPTAQIQSLKPWMMTMTITVVELQRLGFTPEGVDVQYHKKAGSAGKSLGELETLEEQVAFITTIGAGQESEMIVSTLRELSELPAAIDEIVAAWRTGDLATIDKRMSEEMRTEFPKVFEQLIVNRNKAWLPKIEAMLDTEPKELILVGVAHLAGNEGVLHALKERGCSIEQVKVPAP